MKQLFIYLAVAIVPLNIWAQDAQKTIDLDERHEGINEFYVWGEDLIILTASHKNKEKYIRHLSPELKPLEEYVLKQGTSRGNYLLEAGANDTFFFATDPTLHSVVKINRAFEQDYLDINYLGMTNRFMGFDVTKQGPAFVLIDRNENNNEKNDYTLNLTDNNGKLISKSDIQLPGLKYGHWHYDGCQDGIFYFNAVKEKYNEDHSVTAVSYAINPNGSVQSHFQYHVQLENNMYPAPAWTGAEGHIDHHGHFYLDFENDMVYVYGFYQKKPKSTGTGVISKSLHHLGIFVHKLDFNGKVIWKKQFTFEELGIKDKLSNNKYISLFSIDKEDNIDVGILSAPSLIKKHPYLITLNKDDGKVISEVGTSKVTHFDGHLATLPDYEPFYGHSSWSNTKSVSLKSLKGAKNIDAPWKKHMANIINKRSEDELNQSLFYTILPSEKSYYIIETDLRKGDHNLNIYRYSK